MMSLPHRADPAPQAQPRGDWGQDAFTSLCLFFLLGTVAWSVMSAGWVKPMPWLSLVTLLAALAGLLLARRRAPEAPLFLAGLVLGAPLVLWQVAATLPGETWDRQLEEFWTRLSLWLEVAGTGGVSNDPLALALFLTALTWLVSYISAWSVFRRLSLWGAVLPSGLVMTTHLNYLLHYSLPLYLFLLAALLLGMRVHFLKRRVTWSLPAWGVFPWRPALAFGLAIVILTGALPLAAFSYSPLVEYWAVARSPWNRVETEWGRLFAGIPAQKPLSRRFFGQAYPLHGTAGLGDQIVLRIGSDYPGYWRARSYDTYTGQGWLASPGQRQPVDDQTVGAQGDYRYRDRAAQRVEVGFATEFLFAAGTPLGVSLPAEVEASSPKTFDIHLGHPTPSLPPDLQEAATRLSQKQGSPSFEEILKALPRETRLIPLGAGTHLRVQRIEPSPPDVVALRPSSPVSRGTVYEVVSSVSLAGEAELQRAGTDYPGWVSDLYLQLPPSLPPRVRELSQELTRGARSPYEKALMLEAYLRPLPYQSQVDPLPARTDAVEHFLFTLRAGHCDYFASALTVMLRSVGVPARLAVGYATGEWDSQGKTYVVRERHAHAWPEVFFPGLGWVDFEPTPYQPLIARGDRRLSSGLLDEGLSGGGLDELEEDFLAGAGLDILPLPPSPINWGRVASVAGMALGGLVGLGFFLGALVFLLWRLSLRGLGYAEGYYEGMCRLASWARIPHRPPQTPQEYAGALSSALPRYAQEIRLISRSYMDARYGRRVLPVADRGPLAQAWRTLRAGLVRRLLGQP